MWTEVALQMHDLHSGFGHFSQQVDRCASDASVIQDHNIAVHDSQLAKLQDHVAQVVGLLMVNYKHRDILIAIQRIGACVEVVFFPTPKSRMKCGCIPIAGSGAQATPQTIKDTERERFFGGRNNRAVT